MKFYQDQWVHLDGTEFDTLDIGFGPEGSVWRIKQENQNKKLQKLVAGAWVTDEEFQKATHDPAKVKVDNRGKPLILTMNSEIIGLNKEEEWEELSSDTVDFAVGVDGTIKAINSYG